MLVRGYGEHPEGLPAELLLMLPCRAGRKIPAHLALEARLRHVGACDRHRPTVYLDHEAPSRAVPKSDPEDEVGSDSDLLYRALTGHRRSQQQGISSGACLMGTG